MMTSTLSTVELLYLYDHTGSMYGFVMTVTGEDGVAATSAYYYQRNLQGDVIGLLDASGSMGSPAFSYAYDAWGNLISVKDANGNTITDPHHVANINPIRYRGYYHDAESGLYYLQSRYYDPEVGRFINADGLIGGNTGAATYNLFAYCANNPVMLVDLTGTCAQCFIDALPGPGLGKALLYGMYMDQVEQIHLLATTKPTSTKKLDTKSVQKAFNESKRGGDFDGVFGLQCVDLSNWFVATYTTLKTVGGNGKDIATNLARKNGLPSPSSTPIALSIYSVNAGVKAFGASGGRYGHTGVVLSVDEANKKVTVIHTWNGLSSPNSRISTYSYPVSGVTFTYIGAYLR